MPPGQSKVELYAALRRDAREGMSHRALERKYRVGWRTVQKALSSALPQPRELYAPRRSKLDPFKPVIDQMLRADLDAPRKQRHTVVRIYRRLINEHAMDDVSYQVVRAYVAKRKPEIRVEAGRGPAQVFIEQSHLAGAEAEVDFGEVAVRLAVVEAVARRDVRDRPRVHPTGRPVLPDHRPRQPLLGPDPVHRPPGPGLAARLRARGVRRPHPRSPSTNGC